MMSLPRRGPFLFLLVLGLIESGSGVAAQGIQSASNTTNTIEITSAILNKSGTTIRVVFSQDFSPTGPQSKPDGAKLSGNPPEITIDSIDNDPLVPNALSITLSEPLSSITGVKVCFAQVSWVADKSNFETDQPVCAPVTQNYEEAKAVALKLLTGIPKSSNEKNIFASGFVATGAGNSQGGGNLSFNPDLGIPGMTAFVNLNKTTVEKGDPKVFNGGARYQTVLPWGRKEIRQMAEAKTETDLASALRLQQQRVFAGAIFDFEGKLEGDPGTFKITNFVGDLNLSLRTRTKRVGQSKGFWRGFLIPLGFEGGQNLSAGDLVQPSSTAATPTNANSTINKVDHIARYLTGLSLDVFYEDWSPQNQLPVKRIELELNGLGRYLFLKEAMYNSSSKLFNTVGDGVRGYGDVNLKAYFFQSNNARVGLKLTYAHGSLPPTFARIKDSFQIGLLYETRDDNTKGK
jgi:hypothetical protein